MATKNVKSTDPRKKGIIAAIKAKSGGTKVTMVKELGDGTFQGDAMIAGPRGGKAQRLGTFVVTPTEAGVANVSQQ